jgi:endonuclease/exonuclease/phosphatase family metal-dependent hydrolase
MLRILTLDLNYYFDKHGAWPARKSLILEKINEINPHIIAFQSVGMHPDWEHGKDQAFQICEESYGFLAHYFQEAGRLENGLVQGSAVISKFPIAEKNYIMLTPLPDAGDNSERIILKTAFKRPLGNFDLFNANFSWVHEQAVQNAKEAATYFSSGQELSIVAGNLNTPPVSKAFLPFHKAGLIDAWQKLYGDKEGPTFETNNLFTRIDYFWLTQAVAKEINKIEIVAGPRHRGIGLSDHMGLLLELNIKVEHD